MSGTQTTSHRTGAGPDRTARALLVGSPRVVLARLVAGDPLGVREVVARRLAERFLLMDADAVQLRALAHCARGARHYRGLPGLAAWIAARVDTAIDELATEEAGRVPEARAMGVREGPDERAREGAERSAWRELAAPLGLAPSEMRSACARFNGLPGEERELFFQVVLGRRPLEAVARERDRPLPEIARRARHALDTLLRGCALDEREEVLP